MAFTRAAPVGMTRKICECHLTLAVPQFAESRADVYLGTGCHPPP